LQRTTEPMIHMKITWSTKLSCFKQSARFCPCSTLPSICRTWNDFKWWHYYFWHDFLVKTNDVSIFQQLAALLITRQVVGNVQEALVPYIYEKYKLSKLTYRLTRAISDRSLKKQVDTLIKQNQENQSTSAPEEVDEPAAAVTELEETGTTQRKKTNANQLAMPEFKVSLVLNVYLKWHERNMFFLFFLSTINVWTVVSHKNQWKCAKHSLLNMFFIRKTTVSCSNFTDYRSFTV